MGHRLQQTAKRTLVGVWEEGIPLVAITAMARPSWTSRACAGAALCRLCQTSLHGRCGGAAGAALGETGLISAHYPALVCYRRTWCARAGMEPMHERKEV